VALARGPWCDLALIIKGRALRALGRGADALTALAPVLQRISEDAGPSYVFRAEQSIWVSVHELPSTERALLKD